MTGDSRTLRPKEKRKASTLLSNAYVYDDDTTMIPAKRGSISKGDGRKEKDKDKDKDKKKKQKISNKYQESYSPLIIDFSQIQEDSDEGEGIFVIDDPDAYDHKKEREYNSDEERRKRTVEKQERENEQLRMEEGLKKKKKKRHASVAAKKYYQVPTDVNGNPLMPIEMRGLTIHSLGKIVTDRKKFHAKRYIWPAGFKSSRVYCSMTNLNARCEYTSEIVDGDSEPKFVVTCYEDPKNPIVIEANTASGAWAQVGKRINDLKEELTGKRMFTQLSGPEMFGFSHPTIAKLIQELPNSELCDRYIFQEYVPSNISLPATGKKGKRAKGKRNGDEGEFGGLYDDDDEDDEEGDEDDSGGEDEYDDEDEDDGAMMMMGMERERGGIMGEREREREERHREFDRRRESGGMSRPPVSYHNNRRYSEEWDDEEDEETGTISR